MEIPQWSDKGWHLFTYQHMHSPSHQIQWLIGSIATIWTESQRGCLWSASKPGWSHSCELIYEDSFLDGDLSTCLALRKDKYKELGSNDGSSCLAQLLSNDILIYFSMEGKLKPGNPTAQKLEDVTNRLPMMSKVDKAWLELYTIQKQKCSKQY